MRLPQASWHTEAHTHTKIRKFIDSCVITCKNWSSYAQDFAKNFTRAGDKKAKKKLNSI